MRSNPFPGTNTKPMTPAQLEAARVRWAEYDAKMAARSLFPVTEAETAALIRLSAEHGVVALKFGTGGAALDLSAPNQRWAFDAVIKMRSDPAA